MENDTFSQKLFHFVSVCVVCCMYVCVHTRHVMAHCVCACVVCVLYVCLCFVCMCVCVYVCMCMVVVSCESTGTRNFPILYKGGFSRGWDGRGWWVGVMVCG